MSASLQDKAQCCALVCLAPGVFVPSNFIASTAHQQYGQGIEGFSFPQPVQMMLVAPFSGPVFPLNRQSLDTPASYGVWGPGSGLSIQNSDEQWNSFGDVSWQACNEQFFEGGRPDVEVAAPPQLPMMATFEDFQSTTTNSWQQASEEPYTSIAISIVPEAETAVEAPEQFHMNIDVAFSDQATTRLPGSTLCRRRRRQRSAPSSPTAGKVGSLAESLLQPEAIAGEHSDEAAVTRISQDRSQELLAELQKGGQEREAALHKFNQMSFEGEESSRATQHALKNASARDAAELASMLQGHVRNAVQSKYANYVVQEIVAVVPEAKFSFIVEELLGFGKEAACHRFACRVVCRTLEHVTPGDQPAASLVDEILGSAKELCNDSFGSYVIRHILEFGTYRHRQQVAEALCTDIMGYARHKHGSHVVEAALRYCAPNDQRNVVEELIRRTDQLVAIASSQYGRHVVKALLSPSQIPSELRHMAASVLEPFTAQLQSSRYGKSVLHSLNAASKHY